MIRATVTLILLIIILSCSTQTVDQTAEGEKLMELSRQWAKASTQEDILSYWADDALVMAPGQPALRGKAALTKMIEGTANIPGFEVSWEPKEVFVSKSGDLAYLIEQNYFSVNDSLGNPIRTYNKVVTIWKKQEDGTWKNVVDMWNEDPSITSIR